MSAGHQGREPIAVIGLGCRFPPDADSPEGFWRNLLGGVDAFRPVPAERWDSRRFYDPDPQRPGKMVVDEAALLTRPLELFDPLAFGISPREADHIDPQQRILLEATWEALEDAGLPQESLRGQPVAVFVGGFTLDHIQKQLSYENLPLMTAQSATGGSMTLLSNRISHVFDFRGPSVTVDTACSSSLVATHLACQALWNDECTTAIAGGVNAITRPGISIMMSKGGFLSPFGRSRAFDARAAGYARGEGGGVAVLVPLSVALRRGDRIYATILATGANQDGRTPGIAMPNRGAQVELLRRTLANAGVDPARVRYVEAHGTGTQVGDTTEAAALDEVLRERRDGKVIVGSVKTNIGHLEAGAGIAGLTKAVLALHHGCVPRNLHFDTPNPAIPFAEMCLAVAGENTPLRAGNGDEQLVAAVNGFGYGGTNANVVLAGPRPQWRQALTVASADDEGLIALPFSARDPVALRARANDLAQTLSGSPALALADLGHTLVHRSSHHDHRGVIVATGRAQLVERLGAFSRGEAVGITGEATKPARVGFVFTGMGPQWWAMGRELMQTQAVFAAAIDRVDALFSLYAGWSLKQELLASEVHSQVGKTNVAQPANFAVQHALVCLLESWGLTPDVIAGHSVGEIAAAVAAGALTLEEAVRLTFYRSQAQQGLTYTGAQPGGMLATGVAESEAPKILRGYPELRIAAINSPTNVTFSGDRASVDRLAEELTASGVFNRKLAVEVAYHSHHMEPLRSLLVNSLGALSPHAARVPFYSTVAGDRIEGQALGTDYWCRNMCEPVRFRATVDAMLRDDVDVFVEIGPHPVLRMAITEIAAATGGRARVLGTLRRGEPELPRLLETLAGLYVLGAKPKWDAVCPTRGTLVRLPSYPWQRRAYWSESADSRALLRGDRGAHPLLQQREPVVTPTWRAELNAQYAPWMFEHVVDGEAVLPGAAYIEAACAMLTSLEPGTTAGGRRVLAEVDFHQLLRLERHRLIDARLTCDPQSRRWTFAASERGESSWTVHASGSFVAADTDASAPGPLPAWSALDTSAWEEVPPEQLYAQLLQAGLAYGPRFQTVRSVRREQAGARALIDVTTTESIEGYVVHPTLLDGVFQSVAVLLGGEQSFVPVGAERIEIDRPVGSSLTAQVTIQSRSYGEVLLDVALFAGDGPVGRLSRVAFRPLPRVASARPLHFAMEWVEKKLSAKQAAEPGSVLLVAEEPPAELAAALKAREVRVSHATLEALPSADDNHGSVAFLVPAAKDDLPARLEEAGEQLLAVVRRLLEAKPVPRLLLVDRASGPDGSLTGGALTALLRVVRAEHPELRTRVITTTAAAAQLADEIIGEDPETQVRLIDGRREVPRIVPLKSASADEREPEFTVVDLATTPVKLAIEKVGVISTLGHELTDVAEPGPGEVLLNVELAGVNFKDLLKITGQLDPRAMRGTFWGDAIGMECIATVKAVGSDVRSLRAGDRVGAWATGGVFRSFCTTLERRTVKVPDTLDAAAAISMVPALAAWHGLIHVARVEAGETVLVHNAAGATGFVTAEIARMRGARVIATAGTEEKKRFLREQGYELVSDSRSLAFVRDVRAWTDGAGVDVVISSLSGDRMAESIRLLKCYGRYVDLGKRAFIDNDRLSLRHFNEALSYTAIDMDRVVRDRPDHARHIVASAFEALAKGELRPPPVRVFPADQVVPAFRALAQGDHLGRIVIDYGRGDVRVRKARAQESLVGRDGTYVVSGGLAGFGAEVARWLAAEGAGALLLLGRRGADTPGCEALCRELEGRGAKVRVAAVDIGSRDALARELTGARVALPPIRGVFHGAVVLDDCPAAVLTRSRLARSLAAKARGAWNLHHLTESDPLDQFVLFSSISALVGNAGQAAYAMANGFLDALAAERRSGGKPATSVWFGALRDTGILARDQQVKRMLEAGGVLPMATNVALGGLASALRAGVAQVTVADLDWARWSATSSDVAAQPMFSRVRSGGAAANAAERQLAEQLLSLDRATWPDALADRIASVVADVLQMDRKAVPDDKSLANLGVDSLLAVELAVALNAKGLTLKAVEVARGPTIRELARRGAESIASWVDEHPEELEGRNA